MRRLKILLALSLVSLPASLFGQATGGGTRSESSAHRTPHDPIKCGTAHYATEIQAIFDDAAKGSEIQRELKIMARPEMQRSKVSARDHFRIHYDIDGENAPNLRDLDGNGHPDYIDSVDFYLEHSWTIEIDSLGFATPPPDNPQPGSGGVDGRIDVYVSELDGQYYGLAWPDPEGRIDAMRVTGYLEIDNDYREFPTSGIDGLRVTIAHEFFHIIQFSAYYFDLSQASLYESTSTYIEYAVHPDVSDYKFYTRRFLAAPHDYPFSTHNTSDGVTGYAHMLYIYTITELVGTNILGAIWDRFKINHKSMDAIDEALIATNSGQNLTTSFCTFARWSYFTGDNIVDTSYFPPPAVDSTLRPAQIKEMNLVDDVVFIDDLVPLSFGLYRIYVERENPFNPDTVDFLVTNAPTHLGAGGAHLENQPDQFALTISRTPIDDGLKLIYRNDTLYYRLQAPHSDFCVDTFLNGSPGVAIAVRPSPQPFVNDGANTMTFAVDAGLLEVQDIHLQIYSTSMSLAVDQHRSALDEVGGMRGISWDGRMGNGELAPSGVYLFTITIDDNEPSIGKIVIVRK